MYVYMYTYIVQALILTYTCTMHAFCAGVHVEITTEESSQPMGGATSSTSSAGDREEDDETLPTLSSEQLARRPSFKSVGILYCKHSNFPEEAEGLHVQCRADQIIPFMHTTCFYIGLRAILGSCGLLIFSCTCPWKICV